MIFSWTIEEMAKDHAKWIEGLLKTTNGVTIETCKYVAETVFLHAWKHAEKEMLPKHGQHGKFVSK